MESTVEYTDHKFGVNVDLDDIHVDLAVQRAIVPSRLRKLVNNFDPILLGELLVSERPEGLFVLDGQHRLEAVKHTNGRHTVTCEVFSGLSKADEARLFMGRNDRANIARTDRDRNLATAEDQDTLAVQMAAQSAGFVFIAESASDTTFKDRAAGVAIMKDAERRSYIEATGEQHLASVFGFYARVYGNQDVVEPVVLKALSKIFVNRNPVDEDRLYDRLRGVPPQVLAAQADQRRRELSGVRGISRVGAAVEIIAEHYNRGLPTTSANRIRTRS